MSNDNKTLADAQPGGRVRLGDAIPSPLFDLREAAQHVLHCADCGGDYNCGRPMIDALTTLGIMKKTGRGLWSVNARAAQAVVDALSAQPSPGGQGDSRSEKAATFLRQYLTYLRSSPRQGLRPRWCDVYEAIEVAIEALAARQPVGQEPVAFMVRWKPEGGFGLEWPKNMQYFRDRADEYEIVPLHREAPPAQAVDLERARDEGHDGAIRYVLGYLNGAGDCGSTAYDEILNACGRERIIRSAVENGELEFTGLGRWVEMYGTADDRALIESQAVGK